MIDSILNQEKKRIVLDHLLIKNLIYNNILITDVTSIKRLAVEHYQKYAIPQSTPMSMNERWNKQYQPKMTIDPKWYQSIIDLPIWDE